MSIGRHTAYNLIGFAVPTVLALVTVPAYLALIGSARYGVLSLAWLILGYFGLFDLGLGRATTQRIAAMRGAPREEKALALTTALVANIGIGLLGAAILWPVAGYVFGHTMNLEPALRAEMMASLPWLALAVPVATTLGVLSGALTGLEKFRETNSISVVSTVLFQLFPLAVAWLAGPDLPRLILASLAARMIGLVMLARACRREFGPLDLTAWDRAQLGALLAFGGWVTLTSMFGPLLVFSDRFFIGSILGAVAVTVYTVPMEAMRRISGVANSLANALFPRLAIAGRDEACRLAGIGTATLYAALTPVVAGAIVLMEAAMRLWLGHGMGLETAALARVFLVAYWFNVFALIPYTRLQANGRPDVVSKIMLAELPPYLVALYFALVHFGLDGAVYVFLARVVIDTLLMFFLSDIPFAHGGLILGTLAGLEGLEIALRFAGPASPAMQIGLAVAIGAASLVPALWVLPAAMRERLFRMLRRQPG